MTSHYDEWANEGERAAWLRLEKWLLSIRGKLTPEEQLIGTALIVDFRNVLGLPTLPSPQPIPT